MPKAAFLKELTKLDGLLEFVDNAAFQKKWAAVKQSNKERLAHYVETTLGFKVNTRAMFDVQIKRLHEYKVRLGVCVVFGVFGLPGGWGGGRREGV